NEEKNNIRNSSKELQCTNCKKFGHKTTDCFYLKNNQHKNCFNKKFKNHNNNHNNNDYKNQKEQENKTNNNDNVTIHYVNVSNNNDKVLVATNIDEDIEELS